MESKHDVKSHVDGEIVFRQYIKRVKKNYKVSEIVPVLDGEMVTLIQPLERYGIMLAVWNKGKISIGWSRCSKKDKFNKKFGEKIAMNRALSNKYSKIPCDIMKDIERFVWRVRDYEEKRTEFAEFIVS